MTTFQNFIKDRVFMKKIFLIPILLIFSGLLFFLSYKPVENEKFPIPMLSKNPAPTEYLQMKKAKKEFKKNRRQWIENMHRTAPGTDWRKIDDQTQQEKNKKRSEIRKNLVQSGKLTAKEKYIESFNNRDLIGFWEEKGSNNLSGRMLTTDYDVTSNTIYGASQGNNIWMGDLGGNWTNSLNDHLKINNIQMVKAVPNGDGIRLIVVQDSPAIVYYTDDHGITWNTAAGFDSSGRMSRGIIVNDGNYTMYVVRENSGNCMIYRSSDLGDTFSQIGVFAVNAGKMDLWSPKYGSPTVFFLNRNTLFKLENDSFVMVTAFSLNFSSNEISKTVLTGCEIESATYLYAMYRANNIAYFYQSIDGGQNWQFKSQIENDYLIPFTKNSFSCSSLDPLKIYVGGMECFRSFDGGANWTKLNEWWEYYDNMGSMLHADIPGIDIFRIDDNFEFVLISTDGGTYASYDDLLTVQNISLSGLRISQYYSTYTHRLNPRIVFAGSQDQGFQRTLNGQDGIMDLTQIISGDYGHIVSGDNGNSVWSVYPGFAIYYPEATENTDNSRWDFEGDNYLWMPPLMEDPHNPRNVYVAGGGSTGDAHLWHLFYESGNISAFEEPYNFAEGHNGTRVSAMAYSPLDIDHWFVLTSDGRFFYSHDGGIDWQSTPDFNGPNSHYFYGSSIIASPTEIGTIYIAGSGYSNPAVYVSEDGGHSFSAMNTDLPNTLVYEMAIVDDGSYLFAATEVGPYACDLHGNQEWFDLAGVSGPDQVYWTVDYIPVISTVRFGTYGRGIWDFVIGEDVSTSENLLDEEMSQISLSNFPNPFRTSTTISFSSPKKIDNAEISIFNTKGQKVKTFPNLQIDKSSNQQISWNAENHPSGVYFYRLKTENGESKTQKMILLR